MGVPCWRCSLQCWCASLRTDLCGEAPGEIRKPQQVKVAESRTGDCAWTQGLCVPQFQTFQVTGKRGGRGINEFCSCVKDQSQVVILGLDVLETLFESWGEVVALWLMCTRTGQGLCIASENIKNCNMHWTALLISLSLPEVWQEQNFQRHSEDLLKMGL